MKKIAVQVQHTNSKNKIRTLAARRPYIQQRQSTDITQLLWASDRDDDVRGGGKGIVSGLVGRVRSARTGTLYSEYIIIYVHSYIILYYNHTKFGPLSVNIASAVEHNRESCGVSAVRKGGKHNKKKEAKRHIGRRENGSRLYYYIYVYVIVILLQ